MNKKLAEKDYLTIIDLYYNNDVEDIAKIYNIVPTTIYKILKNIMHQQKYSY